MEPLEEMIHEILDNQRRLMGYVDHALAGPEGDKGPRRGWLRGMIADLDRLATHPLVVAMRAQGGE